MLKPEILNKLTELNIVSEKELQHSAKISLLNKMKKITRLKKDFSAFRRMLKNQLKIIERDNMSIEELIQNNHERIAHYDMKLEQFESDLDKITYVLKEFETVSYSTSRSTS
jgi:hypothetical protein